MNGDRHLDIVCTNGDNADCSVITKPYHGIRIYLNDGDFTFKQVWFYPMPGASQALARDFDQDGDMGLAAISFFPLLDDTKRKPAQVFVYLENKGNLTFKPQTWPVPTRAAGW